MLDLLAAIGCSTAIALILKHGEERDRSRYAVLAVNYSVAAVLAFLMVAGNDLFQLLERLSLRSLTGQLASGHSTDGFLTPENSALWALLWGIPTGVLYFLGFYFYQRAVKESGVGLAGSYAKMGILVPMTLSMLFWREFPSGLQWGGMALALAAIGLVNLRFGGGGGFRAALILLFLSSGTAEFTGKLYQRFGASEVKDLFLFFLFTTALLISVLRIRKRPSAGEILTGLSVGIPNFFASYFLIASLSKLPASVVFPTYGAGSIALICLGGLALFRERLSGREYAAVFLTMVALFLINLQR